MKEFVEKLICGLEELTHDNPMVTNNYILRNDAISIANQLAEEHKEKDCSKCSRRSWYQKGYADAEKNNGWILCERELPKKSGKYLVTQERYSLEDKLYKRPIAIEVDHVDFNANDNSWSRARFFKVIAWQPLPEPYQKGE